MSRSRRKNPVFGITTCVSERKDKITWHRRWRAKERTALNGVAHADLEAYLPSLENQVSNVWDMGKDGRQYWPVRNQIAAAEQTSQRIGHTVKERAALKQRLLHKWMGK